MPRDRRQFNRFDTLLIVELSSRLDDSRYFFGLTKNVSFEGFVFESQNYELKTGEVLEFKLRHPRENIHVTLMGKVLWKRETGFECETGIRFIKVDSEERSKIFELVSSDKSLIPFQPAKSVQMGTPGPALKQSAVNGRHDGDVEDLEADTVDKPMADFPDIHPTPPDSESLKKSESSEVAAEDHNDNRDISDEADKYRARAIKKKQHNVEFPFTKDTKSHSDSIPADKAGKGRSLYAASGIFIIAATAIFYGLVSGTLDDLTGYPVSGAVQNLFSASTRDNPASELSSALDGSATRIPEAASNVPRSGQEPVEHSAKVPADLLNTTDDEAILPAQRNAKHISGTDKRISSETVSTIPEVARPEKKAGNYSGTSSQPRFNPLDSGPDITVEKSGVPRGLSLAEAAKPMDEPHKSKIAPENNKDSQQIQTIKSVQQAAVMDIKKIQHPNTKIAPDANLNKNEKNLSVQPAIKKGKQPPDEKAAQQGSAPVRVTQTEKSNLKSEGKPASEQSNKVTIKMLKSETTSENKRNDHNQITSIKEKETSQKPPLVTAKIKLSLRPPDPASLRQSFTKYEEQFNDNKNGWDIFHVGAASADIIDGAYKITNRRKEGTLAVLHYADFPHDRDFVLEVYIKPERISTDCNFGLILGAKDALNNLSFQIGPKGRFVIKRYSKGVASTLMRGNADLDISSGGRLYILKIMNIGGQLAFFLGENNLWTTTRPNFFGNKIGFILEGSSDISVEKTRSFIRNDLGSGGAS